MKDLFQSMDIADADYKAVRFYAVMYLYYSIYDGAQDKEKVIGQLEAALNEMIREF